MVIGYTWLSITHYMSSNTTQHNVTQVKDCTKHASNPGRICPSKVNIKALIWFKLQPLINASMFRKEGRRKTEKKEQQFKTMRKFEIQKRKKIKRRGYPF